MARCKHGFLFGQCGLCGYITENYTESGRIYDNESGKVSVLTLKTTNNPANNGKNKANQVVKLDKTPDKIPEIPVRNIRKIIKKEVKSMYNKEKCLIEGCEKKGKSRGLCSIHWYHWRHGNILHPTLGKWEASDHYKQRKHMMDDKKKAVDKSLNGALITGGGIPESAVFHEFRKRLRQLEALAITLTIFGQGDQVKKEINLFAQNFLKK